MASIYSSIVQTKTGSYIPLLSNGKTIESKYNPEMEAERICSTIKPSSFYIVLGIGSGILLNSIKSKYPDSFILAVESTFEDIDFLIKNFKLINNFLNDKQILFTTKGDLFKNLLNNFIPAFHKSFEIIEQKAWCNENQETYFQIKAILNEALKSISADFSVQSHFGKIWMGNILNNLKLFDYTPSFSSKAINNKTAVVVAAGPSLDNTINLLKNNSNKYFIISTDTAYSTLLKNNIFVDAVISVDGQNISTNHFLHNTINSETLFIFDLCSNYNAVKYIKSLGNKILFAASGHPVSDYAYSQNKNSFLHLFTGAGTVTIAALDFAIQSGFSKIEIFGADFAYSKGKSYTKGTYLDSLYNQSAYKISSTEKTFDKLLFRTPLEKIQDNIYSTTVLNSYKASLEEYLNFKNCTFEKKDNIYYITNSTDSFIKIDCDFNYYDFIKQIDLNYISTEKNTINELTLSDFLLLPLISWLRNNDNNNSSFCDYLKSAYTILNRYL